MAIQYYAPIEVNPMLLFKPEHVDQIKKDIKTQTRRLGKLRWKVGSVHQAKTGFKKENTFAHLLIKAIRQEPLGCITEADAKAEGYNSVSEYIEVFKQIYSKWKPEEPVWVIDFKRLPALK